MKTLYCNDQLVVIACFKTLLFHDWRCRPFCRSVETGIKAVSGVESSPLWCRFFCRCVYKSCVSRSLFCFPIDVLESVQFSVAECGSIEALSQGELQEMRVFVSNNAHQTRDSSRSTAETSRDVPMVVCSALRSTYVNVLACVFLFFFAMVRAQRNIRCALSRI